MRRLPIRLRVTLAFAAALAVVLLAAGTFVYLRFEAELTRTVDTGLRTRAAEVTALRRSGASLAGARSPAPVEREESFALVLAPDGRRARRDAGRPGGAPDGRGAAPRSRAGRCSSSARTGPRTESRRGCWRSRRARRVVIVGAALDDQRERSPRSSPWAGSGWAPRCCSPRPRATGSPASRCG